MRSKCGKNKDGGTRRLLVEHEPQASVSLMFLPHFDVFCDLLLNRPCLVPRPQYSHATKAFRVTWSKRRREPRIRHWSELTERDWGELRRQEQTHGDICFIQWKGKKKRRTHTCLHVPVDRSRICASLGSFLVPNATFRLYLFFSSLSHLYTVSLKGFPTPSLAQRRIIAKLRVFRSDDTLCPVTISCRLGILKLSRTVFVFVSPFFLFL